MRLNKSIMVDSVRRQLVDERIVLDLHAPGRAQFTVMADDSPINVNALVVFDAGYAHQDSLSRFFIGLVDKAVELDSRRRLFCRELSATLSLPLPLSLRHVSMKQVLTEITDLTGLQFSSPDVDYATRKAANFVNLGSGYLAIDRLAQVFEIDDFIWQQQGSAVIFAGSWQDSRWALMDDIEIPREFYDQASANESARIAAMPQLRPGMRVNGNRLQSIEFQGSHMVLAWGQRA